MPGAADFAGALANVPFVASTSSFPDETTQRTHVILPTHTPLESWGHSEPVRGIHGLQQPVMGPLFDTKHLGDVLLETGRSLGDEIAAAFPRRGNFYDLLQDTWETLQPEMETESPSAEAEDTPQPDFDDFWAAAQRRGGVFASSAPATSVALAAGLFEGGLDIVLGKTARSLTLLVYPSLHFYDGRGANRPWLQEIPDPLMKTTWGSWLETSRTTADSIGAEEMILTFKFEDQKACHGLQMTIDRSKPKHTFFGTFNCDIWFFQLFGDLKAGSLSGSKIERRTLRFH